MLCTAVIAGGVGLGSAGGALAADDPGSVKVAPAKATPGSEIKLLAAGCDGTTGVAKSEAFVADADLVGQDGPGFPLSGEAMVRSTVTPGAYEIVVDCADKGGQAGKGRTVRGEFEVVKTRPSSPAPAKESPTAPIKAGGGGAADDVGRGGTEATAAAEGQSPATRYALIGALLTGAAGLAAAGRLVRRRRGVE
ncbi:hypothetical protein [Streptomyces apocyni]|uniref:hypothetical protein n=1 Tax=Streptomyces apocyni TaxID=2654677 RepID=UPI0012E9BA13|nr:hypothetical protein [Streptomyces apocyni]